MSLFLILLFSYYYSIHVNYLPQYYGMQFSIAHCGNKMLFWRAATPCVVFSLMIGLYNHHGRYHLVYHRHVCYTLSMYIKYSIGISSSCFYLNSQCTLDLSIWDAEKRNIYNIECVCHCYWLSF